MLKVTIVWRQPQEVEKPVPREKSQECGLLFLIGGAAKSCLKRFIRLAGGPKAHIVILPHASLAPRKAARALAQSFAQAGAGQTSIIMPRSSSTIANDATAVFFTGGAQARLVQLLSPVLCAQLYQFFQAGGLVGGTSAGAAAMAQVMIADGMNDGILRPGSLCLQNGLGFVVDVVVDTHFQQRARFNRLMAAVTLVSGSLGIGLDEDTAVEIDTDGIASVYGQGHAWFFALGAKHDSNLSDAPKRQHKACVAGVEVSTLSAGEQFSLKDRSWSRFHRTG